VDLINTFKAFDKNGNGTISREELFEGYKELYSN
jgi:Ca2+-binding EF-hand superfamily protein